MRFPNSTVSIWFLAAAAGFSQAAVVSVINGYSVTYPGNKFGVDVVTGVPQDYVKIAPAKEYYLDYQVWFESDWQWVKGGKLPGLVGGAHTSGCRPIVTDGWSARFMWHENGGGHFYYYHQDRVNDCGDTQDFLGGLTMKKTAWNRITEHVVINSPGQSNGSAQAWLNGQKVTDKSGIKWRGNVAENVALVDQVSLQTFYGGSTQDWAPSATTHANFSALIVTTTLPDFSKPFEVPSSIKGGAFQGEGMQAKTGRKSVLTDLCGRATGGSVRGAAGPRFSAAGPRFSKTLP